MDNDNQNGGSDMSAAGAADNNFEGSVTGNDLSGGTTQAAAASDPGSNNTGVNVGALDLGPMQFTTQDAINLGVSAVGLAALGLATGPLSGAATIATIGGGYGTLMEMELAAATGVAVGGIAGTDLRMGAVTDSMARGLGDLGRLSTGNQDNFGLTGAFVSDGVQFDSTSTYNTDGSLNLWTPIYNTSYV